LLTPPETAVSSRPAASLSGGALVREIKTQLKRVGCYSGSIDDKWTTSETQSSIGQFVKHASLSGPPREPDAAFLETLRSRPARVCPLECGDGQVERNGRCIVIVCPTGSFLGSSGRCEKRKERIKTTARPPNAKPASPPAVEPSSQPAPGGYGRRGGKRGRVTLGGQMTCGRNGCQYVPQGCYAVRRAGGGGKGGRIVCP
jgi:hypothetical protein